MEKNLNIRWLVKRDFEEILEIERLTFNKWTYEDLSTILKQKNSIGFVIEIDDRVIGFSIHVLEPKNLKIERLIIHPDFRRKGYGTALIDKLKSKIFSGPRKNVKIIVSGKDLGTHLFLKDRKFICTTILKQHFDREDGYLFFFFRQKEADDEIYD